MSVEETTETTKWLCPVCGCPAYQRFGGNLVNAIKVTEQEDGSEVREPTTVRMGRHFMCKGCSVHFSNPKLFSRKKRVVSVEQLAAYDGWTDEQLDLMRRYYGSHIITKEQLQSMLGKSRLHVERMAKMMGLIRNDTK